jgi:hypothetical protein
MMATIAGGCRKSPGSPIDLARRGRQRHRDRRGCQALHRSVRGRNFAGSVTHVRRGFTRPVERRGVGCRSALHRRREPATHGSEVAAFTEWQAPGLTLGGNTARGSALRVRSSRQSWANPDVMALAQRCGDEMPKCSEGVCFRLIRESLKCTGAPGCVGFCANATDPDGGEAAPMGWNRSSGFARTPLDRPDRPAVALRQRGSRYAATAGPRAIAPCCPTSPARGELT